MTNDQARQTIDIVLRDQRVEVLNEVKKVVEEQRREAQDAEVTNEVDEIGHLATVNAMDVLDAKLDAMMKRDG